MSKSINDMDIAELAQHMFEHKRRAWNYEHGYCNSYTCSGIFKHFGGKRKLNKICKNISCGCYPIKVYCDKFVNEEEPSDNWPNVIFEEPAMQNDSETERNTELLIRARELLCESLAEKKLELQHECNGDGDGVIMMSYRIVPMQGDPNAEDD